MPVISTRPVAGLQYFCNAAFMQTAITITRRGVITLPARLRRALGLRAEDQLIAEVTPEGLLLRPAVTLPVEVYSTERVREFDEAEQELAARAQGAGRADGPRQGQSASAPHGADAEPGRRSMRVFLDANVLFSAAKSNGAIRSLLRRLHSAGHAPVADSYVVAETRRNLLAKGPEALGALDDVLLTVELATFRPCTCRRASRPGFRRKTAPSSRPRSICTATRSSPAIGLTSARCTERSCSGLRCTRRGRWPNRSTCRIPRFVNPAGRRRMNLHEYQSKQLFARYGIPVPTGFVASTPEEAADAARRLGGGIWVVKAQVHAGGRGKAGGVKVVKTVGDVTAAAAGMLGKRLTTKQTGPEGLPINQVYVESGSKIERELYLSLLLNRDSGRIAFVASAAGGMDIEEVAAKTPEKIIRVEIHPATGLQGSHCRTLALRPRAQGRAGRRVRDDRARALQAVSRMRREPRGGEPADRHGRRPRAGARRQDRHRGQRALPPEGPRRLARHVAGRRDGAHRGRSATSTTSRSTATSPAW